MSGIPLDSNGLWVRLAVRVDRLTGLTEFTALLVLTFAGNSSTGTYLGSGTLELTLLLFNGILMPTSVIETCFKGTRTEIVDRLTAMTNLTELINNSFKPASMSTSAFEKQPKETNSSQNE